MRDPLGEAMVLIAKGALALDEGEVRRAADHYRQAQDLARAVCAAGQEAEALDGLLRCEADSPVTGAVLEERDSEKACPIRHDRD